MATRFRLIKPHFDMNICTATNNRVDDFVPILGFLGEWNNPTHIVMAIGEAMWLINMAEVTWSYISPGGDAEDVSGNYLNVIFEYTGTDSAFLSAAITEWGKNI